MEEGHLEEGKWTWRCGRVVREGDVEKGDEGHDSEEEDENDDGNDKGRLGPPLVIKLIDFARMIILPSK